MEDPENENSIINTIKTHTPRFHIGRAARCNSGHRIADGNHAPGPAKGKAARPANRLRQPSKANSIRMGHVPRR